MNRLIQRYTNLLIISAHINWWCKLFLGLSLLIRDKNTAEAFLNDWVLRAHCSKIPILSKFANTLLAHRTGILAYYDHPISTGPLEGTNNKIKTMKRQAYGFRDMEFFKLKIMAIHESKYALIGWTTIFSHKFSHKFGCLVSEFFLESLRKWRPHICYYMPAEGHFSYRAQKLRLRPCFWRRFSI